MADNLTQDLIKIILSKLPVASLLRFKVVSTEWYRMITDPRFIRTYDRGSQNLFLAEGRSKSASFLVRLEGENIQIEAVFPMGERDNVMCTANGIVLVLTNASLDYKTYMIWNACTREKVLTQFPHSNPDEHEHFPSLWGACPDPGNDDYKVVIAYMHFYAVLSFKNRAWSPIMECPPHAISTYFDWNEGVFVDGAIYWFISKQIIYFDPKDDSFKIQDKPQEVEGKSLRIIAWKGCLSFYYKNEGLTRARFWVKEKGSMNSWKKLMIMDNLPEPLILHTKYVAFDENKILIQMGTRFVVYDSSTKSYTELKYLGEGFLLNPYRETLFFPPTFV